MKVQDLIAELMQMPTNLEVEIWDESESEYMPVKQVLWEDGVPAIHLLTYEEKIAE